MGLISHLHAPAALTPLLIVEEAGWTPRSVWTGTENLTPTRISLLRHTSLRIAVYYTVHWGDPDADGRIILRWIFRKWEGVVGTGWSWLRIGTDGGHL